MKEIICLSDLHVGLSRKETRRTRTIVDNIGTSFAGVPVIFAGDLTDSATKNQFMRTRQLLDRLARTNPVLTVPGNHDYAWKGSFLRPDGWKNWVKYLGSPLGWNKKQVHWLGIDHEPEGVDGLGVWRDKKCVYFGIDSGDPDDKQISARGYISKRLADALRASLEKYQGKTRIVVLHHHPFTAGILATFTKLHGSRRLLASLKNRCELLLFGHEHEYGIWWSERGVLLTVSSHKSTDTLSGDCLMFTVIQIRKPGTSEVLFRHRLEVLQL
ncbi:MAG: metallophosphoesterase family protein [Planctomycetota bacterium]|jgi:3',5'-cyclic AMP phosphodiesterase CpdA